MLSSFRANKDLTISHYTVGRKRMGRLLAVVTLCQLAPQNNDYQSGGNEGKAGKKHKGTPQKFVASRQNPRIFFVSLHSFAEIWARNAPARKSLIARKDRRGSARVYKFIFWNSTGGAHDILIKMSERGNGIRNSWIDLLNPYRVAV